MSRRRMMSYNRVVLNSRFLLVGMRVGSKLLTDIRQQSDHVEIEITGIIQKKVQPSTWNLFVNLPKGNANNYIRVDLAQPTNQEMAGNLYAYDGKSLYGANQYRSNVVFKRKFVFDKSYISVDGRSTNVNNTYNKSDFFSLCEFAGKDEDEVLIKNITITTDGRTYNFVPAYYDNVATLYDKIHKKPCEVIGEFDIIKKE